MSIKCPGCKCDILTPADIDRVAGYGIDHKLNNSIIFMDEEQTAEITKKCASLEKTNKILMDILLEARAAIAMLRGSDLDDDKYFTYTVEDIDSAIARTKE